MANLYLLPSFLSADSQDHIPPVIVETIRRIDIFVVERIRTSRRFIRAMIKDYPIDKAEFIELNKHDLQQSLKVVKDRLGDHKDIGLLSEAGAPCIADPGARVVNLARDEGYVIRPLTGPSSIILGLMASGMNGQEFSFHGYLPIKDDALAKKLREISKMARSSGSTHLFIETPYRNDKLKKQIIKNVDPKLYLSVSKNLNSKEEEIITKPIGQWPQITIGKVPAIFSIGSLVL